MTADPFQMRATRSGPSLADHAWYLAGVVGLSAALTAVWLGMRAVMNIGGSCASGGPYVNAVECSAGVDVLMFLAFPVGFASVGLLVWKGSRLGGSWVGLAALAWPVLFLSLGWNFLEYGVNPPYGGGLEWGWLIPGVLFVLMGGIPLLGWLLARGHGPVVPGVRSTMTPIELNELSRAMRQLSVTAARRGGADATIAQAMRTPEPSKPLVPTVPSDPPDLIGTTDSLVSQLERLARLRESGALSDAEYDDAKRSLLAAASRGALP